MAKKYDTNPLDPDFPQQAKETQTQTLPNLNAETERFPYAAPTEEQTRKFDEADFNGYQSTYNGQNTPANFHTTPLGEMNKTSKRKVSKIGLPENILTALPYIPFYIGLIAGILILLLVPKSETKVRFHAAQGLAAHIGILIITSILSGVGNIAGFASIGGKIFTIVTMIMLIIWTIKAWQGKPVHIESVDDLTEWLEEKINPRN